MKLKEGNPKAQEIEPSQLGEAFRSGVLLTDLLQVVCEKKPGKVCPSPSPTTSLGRPLF